MFGTWDFSVDYLLNQFLIYVTSVFFGCENLLKV